jgi:hypothetical protein
VVYFGVVVYLHILVKYLMKFEDNDDQYMKDIIWDIEQENFVFVPDFGIYHLNIWQAAELIALDMWYSGEIDDVGEPEGWDETEYDTKLIKELAKYVQEFEVRLTNAVESERLKTVKIQRNLDEQIVSEQTYIHYNELLNWLAERGYDGGDILNEWTFTEADIGTLISREVNYLRAVIKENRGKIPRGSNDNFQEMYKKIAFENQVLKNEIQQLQESQSHQTKLNNPVSTKARKSFLLIIEALCKKNELDSQERGMAGKIQRIIETQIGQRIDDETIRNILTQIPDALE